VNVEQVAKDREAEIARRHEVLREAARGGEAFDILCEDLAEQGFDLKRWLLAVD
jgi:hypothetical protein